MFNGGETITLSCQSTDHSNTKATFVTPAVPLDISLSCDSLTLSVCFKEGGTLKCLLFDVRGLAGKVLVCIANSHNNYETIIFHFHLIRMLPSLHFVV